MQKYLPLLMLAFCLGCEKEEPHPGPGAPVFLQFEYGLQCGWATFDDALLIDRDSIHMQIARSSPSPTGTQIDTAFATPPHVWQALRDSLVWQDFTALTINTYHLGADGCDYYLQIKRDTASHAIRFGLNDQLPSIRPLLRQLDSTWAQYGPWPPW